MCVGAGVGAALLFFSRGEKGGSPEKYTPRPHGQLTFTKDVAPIIFQQCASCHRPGQSAPFSLLTLDEMRKHATDIADLTRRRVMPPWLPEHGYGEFAGERRLSVDELGVIQQWIAEGANEGRALDLPPVPTWSGDWQLGTPDLIVTMPEPYNMLAEGRDVNRNFVVPVPISAKRYVKSVEFHPGNPKIVHHAFIKVDRTGQSRLLDSEDPEPGFPGINPPAESPASDFLGWQPGRRAEFGRPGLSWPLEPGNDLVFQMHLSPSGKPEQLQSSVGLYFTDQPPTNTCLKLLLTSLAMDIPAGASDYVVEDSYRLPVDVELLGLLPHAHYLAREMEAWATLPNGTREWLLLIKHWDFNWQGAYRYTKPVSLPKGSTLQMRFTYDNSTNNARNPNVPPKAVSYGPQSRDEMAELWLQVLAHNDNELTRLKNDHEIKMARVFLESDLAALRRDPNDARAHTDLGMALLGEGKLADAEPHFQAALRAQPAFALAHYDYALLLRRLSRFDEAEVHFREDLRLAPHDFKAHGNLGAIFLQQGNLDAAQAEFQSALAINPEDSLARQGLEMLRRQRNP
jgi:tetratricopeptide (TPR) repeat protein/mono/diheme cytochrome c family protein